MDTMELYDRGSSSRTASQKDPELELERSPSPQPIHSWQHRLEHRLSTNPRLYRIYEYIRGPRPKVELGGEHSVTAHVQSAALTFAIDPSPFLDIDVTIRGKRIRLPIESTFIRYTRPLTNPWLLIPFCAAYIIGLAFLSRAQSFLSPPDSFIGCTDTFWLSNNNCGLNGEGCLSSDTNFTDAVYNYRCPAQCTSVILQNPRTVGDEQTAFVPLLVGGGDDNATYRGDSFICSAAVHACVLPSTI